MTTTLGGATDGATGAKTVLLVERHPTYRQTLACVLEWQTDIGRVAQAGSLAEARDRCSASVDVAIVDLCLRNGDGLDLIRELRTAHPDAKMLALTLGRDPEHHVRAVQAGANVVLSKQVTLEELLQVTKSLDL
jgi:two-component system, NarL family, response regulator DevR